MNNNRESRLRWDRCHSTECTTRRAESDVSSGTNLDIANSDHPRPFSNRIASRYRRRASRARPQPEARYQWHGARHPNRRTG